MGLDDCCVFDRKAQYGHLAIKKNVYEVSEQPTAIASVSVLTDEIFMKFLGVKNPEDAFGAFSENDRLFGEGLFDDDDDFGFSDDIIGNSSEDAF